MYAAIPDSDAPVHVLEVDSVENIYNIYKSLQIDIFSGYICLGRWRKFSRANV